MPATTVLFHDIAPPPPGWQGDVTALFTLINSNLRVTNPLGYNSFTIGGTTPTTNIGPWLKNEQQWWVWNSGTNAYIPLVLASEGWARDIPDGTALPTSGTASRLFIKHYVGLGRELYWWDGAAWSLMSGRVAGNSTQRPAAPYAYARYFDTDLSTELYFKPGYGWVTTYGSIGSFQYTTAANEADALFYNPGWAVYGPVKGRVIAGHNGAANGLTDRATGTAVGAESHVLVEAEMPSHTHPYKRPAGLPATEGVIGRSTGLTINSDSNIDQGGGSGATGGLDDGLEILYPTGGDQPHNNMQPTLFLIPLRKVQ